MTTNRNEKYKNTPFVISKPMMCRRRKAFKMIELRAAELWHLTKHYENSC